MAPMGDSLGTRSMHGAINGLVDDETTPMMEMPEDFAPGIVDYGGVLFYRAIFNRDEHFPNSSEYAVGGEYDVTEPGAKEYVLNGMRHAIWQAQELFRLGYTQEI